MGRRQIRGICAVSAVFVAAGCSGITDCKDDAVACAAMLNERADKCAFSYQLADGERDKKRCADAVKTVSKARQKAAVPGLIKILATPETGTPRDFHRSEAAKALAKIGDTAAVQPLLAAIDFTAGTSSDPLDKNTNTSNEAVAEALGKLGDTAACGKLIELMDSTRHDYTMLEAVRATGRLKCKEAIKPLSQIALKHDNKFMRKNSVVALGDIGDLGATDTLIQMMFIEHAGVSFYREASFALFQLGPGVAARLLDTMNGKNDAVAQYFARRGGIPETAVKAKCGFVLGDLRDPRAVEPLIEAFNGAAANNDPVLLVYAAAPLGALGDRRAVRPLAKQMNDLDAGKRDPIMRALNQIGDQTVVPRMIAAMSVEHFVKSCVSQGFGDKDACARDKPSIKGAVKAAADHASNLAGAKHAAAFKKQIDKMQDAELKKYFEERYKRVEAAQECKADGACWVKKLGDKDAKVRERAAWELGRLKDATTLAALKKAILDSDTFVRAAAITSYWRFGDKSAVASIEKQLEDEDGTAKYIRVNEDLKRLLVHLRRG